MRFFKKNTEEFFGLHPVIPDSVRVEPGDLHPVISDTWDMYGTTIEEETWDKAGTSYVII